MLEMKNKETEYLLTLLGLAINDLPAKKAEFDIDYNVLFDLAKSQQVYNIILPSLISLGVLNDEQQQVWNNYKFSELQRTITVNNEREKICKKLDNNNIKYMFLKGLVIRDYYPKSSMRQMSDNDILYDATKRDTLLSIMKSNGFYLTTSCENSDDFFKKPFSTFEFHRELFFEEKDFCPRFENLWNNAKKDNENSCKYSIDVNDNYIYSVAHMYKHYSSSGCGVRFLADIYLIDKNEKLDFEYINSEFDKIGILDFALKSKTLANDLFDGKSLDNEEESFLNTFLSGGVYGVARNIVKEEILQNGNSKIKYLFKRLFPSKKKMKANYKKLEKYPFLLLFYYIKRLFEKFYHNNDKMKNELKEIKNIKDKKENK